MVFCDLPGVERPAGVEIQIGFHGWLAFRRSGGRFPFAAGVTGIGVAETIPVIGRIRATDQIARRRAVGRNTNPIPEGAAVGEPGVIELVHRTMDTQAVHIGEINHALGISAVEVVQIGEGCLPGHAEVYIPEGVANQIVKAITFAGHGAVATPGEIAITT